MVTHSAILLLWSVYCVPDGCRSRGSDTAITQQTSGTPALCWWSGAHCSLRSTHWGLEEQDAAE